ncbi:hypothetical protein N7467_002007 [Penicillium canescens]|nr:hypothetical protein N7467_002007 [Penicillium canescens]
MAYLLPQQRASSGLHLEKTPRSSDLIIRPQTYGCGIAAISTLSYSAGKLYLWEMTCWAKENSDQMQRFSQDNLAAPSPDDGSAWNLEGSDRLFLDTHRTPTSPTSMSVLQRPLELFFTVTSRRKSLHLTIRPSTNGDILRVDKKSGTNVFEKIKSVYVINTASKEIPDNCEGRTDKTFDVAYAGWYYFYYNKP